MKPILIEAKSVLTISSQKITREWFHLEKEIGGLRQMLFSICGSIHRLYGFNSRANSAIDHNEVGTSEMGEYHCKLVLDMHCIFLYAFIA